jgi:hypothetical protein
MRQPWQMRRRRRQRWRRRPMWGRGHLLYHLQSTDAITIVLILRIYFMYSEYHIWCRVAISTGRTGHWTNQFISKLLQITHSQWIYQNISLHSRQHGYLHAMNATEIMQEIETLSNLAPKFICWACLFNILSEGH